jgi:DNA-binding NarL/FixJ family response regulator
MNGHVIRVVIVDDDPLVCAHLRTILQAADDIEVVDVAHDGAAAVEAVIQHRPDLVLMDLRMPGVNGLAATRRIIALTSPPAIVALTTFDADQYVLAALRAGATGYLLKSTPPRDFVSLVRLSAAGHTILPTNRTPELFSTAARTTLPDGLTQRDVEILTCLAKGLSNAQIGAQLHLTEATVKGYVSRVLTKLNCANRAQAGLLAQQAGLSEPRETDSDTGHTATRWLNENIP